MKAQISLCLANGTTFILTTDHRRGGGLEQWKEHGVDEKGSENIWISVIGPDTPAPGERQNVGPVTQAPLPVTRATKNPPTDFAVAFPIWSLLIAPDDFFLPLKSAPGKVKLGRAGLSACVKPDARFDFS